MFSICSDYNVILQYLHVISSAVFQTYLQTNNQSLQSLLLKLELQIPNNIKTIIIV